MIDQHFKVLLVDDERMIREGISKLVDWEQLGLVLSGVAADGQTAYDMLLQIRPDIIITDIRMPKMDGLELIERAAQQLPDVRFIVLSGHGEFNYASKAMNFGVKHYLLKPCDEVDITEALQQVIIGLQEQHGKSSFYELMEKQLAEALPKVKEQLLRDCLLNLSYFEHVMDHYKEILNIQNERIRLILFQLESTFEYVELYALKQISEEIVQTRPIMLSTIIGDKFIILIEEMDMEVLIAMITEIKNVYERLYRISLTVAISDSCTFEDIPKVYREAQQYLAYRFYLGEGSLITSHEIGQAGSTTESMMAKLNFNAIVMAIKVGNTNDVERELTFFFDMLREQHCEIHIAISFCIELMTTIVRETIPDKINESMMKLAPILEMKTLEDIHTYIHEVSCTITKENYDVYSQKNRMLVHNMVRKIQENLGNEELSLQWLSKHVFYLNVDYMGKLFRKEMKEKFSQYVTRLRVDWAKELMLNHSQAKVYQIAEQIGFGSDPQYFSNIFKKHTGYTPMEYKSMMKKDTDY